MADEPRAAHAVGMADGDRAAIDIELVIVDAELVARIEDLHRESLVELPQADIVDLEAMRLEQLRHREDGADAHLVRVAASHRYAAIDPERGEVASAGEARFHQHAGARAVRKLRSVAR